ncbi:sigma-70 family RNA polymerase sigma factor [Vibrio algivorus]|uniref:Sigma-70 family RNA polymerase sigma factor n=1 Tax=Vibrio algivorus TaxID=1667024 RepID=A0A557NVA6_9VIBR|nr:sigma-70 family RNA polymerase sigma factor [Vibrio algivorus]TVO32277.1 sigma-70 family RNA polymerase sigma factor [Vibrio algivorus]
MLMTPNYQKTDMKPRENRQLLEEQSVRQNIRLIHRLVNHYRGAVDEGCLEDLQQVALMTYVLELRKFDHIDNDDFKGAVIVRIRGALIDELRQRDHLSRGKRSIVNRIRKAEQVLVSQNKRQVTAKEICSYLDISLSEYNEAMVDSSVLADIELDEIGHEYASSNEGLDSKDLKMSLEKELEKLPEDMRKILYLMYVMGLSTQETALVMEVSEIKVHRLKTKGIELLKQRIID